jgi:hypothetical protein
MKFTKQEYADLHLLYGEAHVVIQERQGDYTVSVFLKESRSTFVEVDTSAFMRDLLTGSSTMVSPILRFHPFGFLFLGPHERFGIRS